MHAELPQENPDLKPQISQVLYIDNDSEISTLVRYSLELFAGWYVATTDERYALDRATADPWDCILLEVALKGGLSLYRQLKADPRTQGIPIVLLTSNVMPADFKIYSEMAIAGVITKPFNPVTLGAHVAALLGCPTPPSAHTFN